MVKVSVFADQINSEGKKHSLSLYVIAMAQESFKTIPSALIKRIILVSKLSI